jgi:hypothetical protein
MKYIKLYEDYNDPLGGTRDMFNIRSKIVIKDKSGNEVRFSGPSENEETALVISKKAQRGLDMLDIWLPRNMAIDRMYNILLDLQPEFEAIGWKIDHWYGGWSPAVKANHEIWASGGEGKPTSFFEGYEDPLKGLEGTRDLFGLTYMRELETGGFSGDYCIEGPSENREEADEVANWIENELYMVRSEYDDLEDGEEEALDQIDIRWNEIKDSAELGDKLEAIGYELKPLDY